MKKYLSLLKYEFKTITKDSMNIFFLVYPFFMLFIMGYLLPQILNRTSGEASQGKAIPLLIGFVVTLAVGGFIMGALLGFSFLENKDEKTMLSIAVTPITVRGFAYFKICYVYVLSIISNLIMVGGLKLLASDQYVITVGAQVIRLLDNLNYLHIVVFSMFNSLLVPFFALILAGFAKSKIEGFAFVKIGGLFVLIPILTIIEGLKGCWQYVLGIAPNFWPVKAMLNLALHDTHPANINYYLYMLIGFCYTFLISILASCFFFKKSNLV